MFLKALEMQGFKSFPEKTVLDFTRGITAVVGPNGSGKSNISDAVRWVLGEQSSKSLRGSKMEDVIFDGTGVRKAYGFAQVTLRLDNSDRKIASMDEDEVSVTRKFYRTGDSEYRINGKAVRLKDVHELFMDTGLGRDGYSIVSQGKIADMVSGKGSECREMLEEAAGISAYRYKRSDALKRLERAQDNIVRLRDIIGELEGRLGPLKSQSEKAKAFLELSEQKRGVEIGLWLHVLSSLRQKLRAQEDRISLSIAAYDSLNAELDRLENQIQESMDSVNKYGAKIDEVRRTISENEERALSLDSTRAVLNNDISHNNETIQRISADSESSKKSAQQLESEIEGEQRLVDKIKQIESQRRESLSLEKQRQEQHYQKGDELERQAADASERSSEIEREVSQCSVSLSAAGAALESTAQQLEQLLKSEGELEQDKSRSGAQLEKARAALDECQRETAQLKSVCDELAARLESEGATAHELKRKLDSTAFEASATLSRANMLDELEKNMEGYSQAVKAVIKQKENGAFSGILGTVSQLIGTKDEYFVAIETALSNAVEHIVCKTEADAKRAIEYLKRERLGRATFLPVATIKGKSLDEGQLSRGEGYIAVASELVECPEQLREIVVSLLGRTVVASNLDRAAQIAAANGYRFKVVTLDGQVVNAGGSLTGGSRSKNAGLLSRSAQIERLYKKYNSQNEQAQQLERQYKQLDEKIQADEAELSRLRGQKSKMDGEKIRLEGEVRLFLGQHEASLKAIEQLSSQKRQLDERRRALQEQCDGLEKKLTQLKEQRKQAEREISAYAEKRAEYVRLMGELSERVSAMSASLHDAQRELAARQTSLNLLKARLVSQEDRERRLDLEIEQLRAKNVEISSEIEQLAEKSAKLRAENKVLEENIKTYIEKKHSHEAESVRLRGSEKDKTAQREALGGERARLEERRESMRAEYEATQSKLYEEYSLTVRQAQEIADEAHDPQESRRVLLQIKAKIKSLGSVNVSAIDEYRQVSERYSFMSEQMSDVERSKRELTRLISELTEKMATRFRERYESINRCFDECFKELFGGGRAQLVLADPADVLESDIDIKLQPPGKNVKRLDSLSGGEKGLSAIALLFAILKVNPAAFCIFDEVEAALDDVNVNRYASYVRRMAENTQFILITHRRGTMQQADVLYGITMQEQGVSKLLKLNMPVDDISKQLDA